MSEMRGYDETIEYLYSQLPMFSVVGAGAYKPGLETALTLSALFGYPHKAFPTIHVAGTNGKGSTSNMLASVLQEAGYRTGLYTSPHIFDFRERIRVNGEKIYKDAVVDFVSRYLNMKTDCSPSFFELTTIMAFEYFMLSNVDIAVIETGLGGRLDTTNIINPLVSVITNVSLDHTAQLGDSIPQIAAEKAGIIKPGIRTVIGYAGTEERDVFEAAAKNNRSGLVYACDSPIVIRDGDDYKWRINGGGEESQLICDLKGDFQIQNINTVLHTIEALRECGIAIDNDIVKKGLSHVCDNTHFFGRWSMTMREGVNIITDTGHNIGAWEWIAPRLSDISRAGNLHVVLGFVSDKIIEPIFRLLPRDAVYHLVSPDVKRARKAEDLAILAEKYGLRAYTYPSVIKGCEAAYGFCNPGDTLFIGGSNYLVSEIKSFLER